MPGRNDRDGLKIRQIRFPRQMRFLRLIRFSR